MESDGIRTAPRLLRDQPGSTGEIKRRGLGDGPFPCLDRYRAERHRRIKIIDGLGEEDVVTDPRDFLRWCFGR